MASNEEGAGAARRPIPNPWEVIEIAERLALLPFIVAPRPIGMLAARVLAAWVLRPGSWASRWRSKRLPPALPARTGLPKGELIRRSEIAVMYERILLMRQIVFPWWRRRIGVHGLSHVRAALDAGRGAILWTNPCVASNVAAKQAVAVGVHPVVHLSRPSHPFSAGPFGMRYINPLLRRPERPFMAERVVIDEAHTVAALRRLRQALKQNQLVSITVTHQAARTIDHPFLGGTLRLPAGPVELAAASGAALLPVFTWTSALRSHVVIGAPLAVSGTSEHDVRETHTAMLSWLEEQVVAHPDAWIGWRIRQYNVDPE